MTSPNLLSDTLAVLRRRLPALRWRLADGGIAGDDAPPMTYGITLAQASAHTWRINVWISAPGASQSPLKSTGRALPIPSAEALAALALGALVDYSRILDAQAAELRDISRYAQKLWVGAKP